MTKISNTVFFINNLDETINAFHGFQYFPFPRCNAGISPRFQRGYITGTPLQFVVAQARTVVIARCKLVTSCKVCVSLSKVCVLIAMARWLGEVAKFLPCLESLRAE